MIFFFNKAYRIIGIEIYLPTQFRISMDRKKNYIFSNENRKQKQV